MIELIKKRIVISGDIIEIYNYEIPYLSGYKDKFGNSGRNLGATNEEKLINREKVLNRAKIDLRRLINANRHTLNKFITLTFAKNETDLNYCNYEFNKFIKRLKYYINKKGVNQFQYIVVVEFQERGAVHYHLLCNLCYIQNNILREIWGNGFVKINRIDRVDNLGAYVTKYMQKDLSDKRLLSRKCYFTSKNLVKPFEITDKKEVDKLGTYLLLTHNTKYSNTFDNKYKGKISYSQYIVPDIDAVLSNSKTDIKHNI